MNGSAEGKVLQADEPPGLGDEDRDSMAEEGNKPGPILSSLKFLGNKEAEGGRKYVSK